MDKVEDQLFRDVSAELDEIQEVSPTDRDEHFWLSLAREAYESSTSYLDANIRQQWETSIAHQNNEHEPGSKYYSDGYKSRSKTFRPKTRTNNVNAEAAFAKAAFSTNDLVSITAENDNDPEQLVSAEVNQMLVQHRLSKTIKWYLTAMGAFQDARVYGICASYQGWEFEEVEVTEEETVMGPMGPMIGPDGQPMMQTVTKKVILKDQPVIDLIPPENIRFEPSADWRDPANDSPYLVRIVPMYAGDALLEIENRGWKEYDIAQIANVGQENEDDQTRQQRQGKERIDPTEHDSDKKEFAVVWLHENFIRVDGEDYVYWTIGSRLLLSDPEPTVEAYPHLRRGERPITIGYTTIEAHKNYPASPTRLIENLQKDVNDIANQRFDNVKLVLNKRYFIRRGATEVDLQSLARNVPGGAIMVGNPNDDVRVVDTPDVTGSSYNDQDRLDLAIDELTGVMSQQTVQNNRNLNETVGGMSMMNKAADQAADYGIKTFIETWMEPTIRQLVRLEQYYETDEVILAIAADKSDRYQQFTKQIEMSGGQAPDINSLLKKELTVNVNIGFGATNPRTQIEQFTFALSNVANLPGTIERINTDEVIKEIFGKVGYRDGQRFFNPPQPPQPPGPSPDKQAELQFKQQELQVKQQSMQVESQESQIRLQMERERWQAELQVKREIEMQKLAMNHGIKMEELHRRLGIEQAKIQTQRDIEAGRQTLEQSQQIMQHRNLEQGYDTF